MRIAIIGGGVVGLCCAVLLARSGHKVTLLEASRSLLGPSWNNAGHIATEQVTPLASMATLRSVPQNHFAAGGALDLPLSQWRTWLPFASRLVWASRPHMVKHGTAALRSLLSDALPAWQRMAQILDDPELVNSDGHLAVSASSDRTTRGRRAIAVADTGTAKANEPTPDDMRFLKSIVGRPVPKETVTRYDGTGSIRDLTELSSALSRTFLYEGGKIAHERAALERDGRTASIQGHEADMILVTAGVESGEIMRSLGHRVPIVAERGYHVRASADNWPPNAPPVVFNEHSMIVTAFRHVVQASSFVEIASFDTPPDPRKWERLERHISDLGLPLKPPFRRWMGARPSFPDYLPAVGRSRRVDNLLYAFGHQHLGLTLAPVTAETILELVNGDQPSIDIRPFDIARFDVKRNDA